MTDGIERLEDYFEDRHALPALKGWGVGGNRGGAPKSRVLLPEAPLLFMYHSLRYQRRSEEMPFVDLAVLK